MYYYGGYSGNNSSCGCNNAGYSNYGGYGYPMYGGGNNYGYGNGAAIVLVLFILLVIIIGARNCCGSI